MRMSFFGVRILKTTGFQKQNFSNFMKWSSFKSCCFVSKFRDSLQFYLDNFKLSFIFPPKRYSNDVGSKSHRLLTSLLVKFWNPHKMKVWNEWPFCYFKYHLKFSRLFVPVLFCQLSQLAGYVWGPVFVKTRLLLFISLKTSRDLEGCIGLGSRMILDNHSLI